MTYEIRTLADAESLSEIAELVSRAFLTSTVFAGLEATRYAPPAILGKLKKGETLVAAQGGRLIGSVTLFPPHLESPCEPFRDAPQVGLLAVAPEIGGTGVGRSLMRAVEDRARELGYDQLALSVTQRGDSLIDLYRRLGYQEVAVFHWPEAIDPSLIFCKSI